MRIAYLTQSYPPMISGAAIAAEQLAKGMANRGHVVLVIAASDTGKLYRTNAGNLTVLRLASLRNPLRANQRLLAFPHRSILQALHEFRPELVHTHEPAQMGFLGLKYACSAKIPILLTVHQLPWFVSSYLPNIPTLRKLVEHTAWAYAGWLTGSFSSVISPTSTISEIIRLKTGYYPVTIPNGIDMNIFNPERPLEEKAEIRTRYGIPSNVPFILHVGRLDADKNVERVLLAAKTIIEKNDAHLLMVGDGSRKNSLSELSISLGIHTQTHFTGFVSNKQEIAKIYRSADVFVTASEIETQGMVLLEAAACCLPIAAVHAACIPEVVHEGVTGFLARPGDISALSHAIELVLAHSTEGTSMRTDCHALAKKYGLEITTEKHETFYLQTLEYRLEQKVRREYAPY